MRRVLSVCLPNLPTDRLRRRGTPYRPDLPLVTAEADGGCRVIRSVDDHAHRLGLRPGQTVAHARILAAGLQIAETDRAADVRFLQDLAETCLKRYSPIVALDPPAGLWIDATGCAALFGGETALMADLASHIAAAGLRMQAAMAGTAGAAHALARFGSVPIAACGREREILAALPIAGLRLPPAMTDALRQLGLDTIGQLYPIPRAPLARRFGIALMRRFDQALGLEAEPLDPVTLPHLMRVERLFAEPICNPDYLAKVIATLSEDLCRRIEEQAQGFRSVDLIARRVDNRITGVRVGASRPSHDARHLTRMLIEKIPLLDVGYGLEKLALAAISTEPYDRVQHAAAYSGQPEADLSGLVDVIANRIGAGHVYRLQAAESDVPERSVTRVAPLSPDPVPRPARLWPRPSRLLHRPERVEAMALLPDHAPLQFIWRRERYRIKRADGPERIFGEWWIRAEETEAVRDYYRVEDEEGRRFWLFRRGDGQDPATGSHEWFLHGFFG